MGVAMRLRPGEPVGEGVATGLGHRGEPMELQET